MKKKYQKLKFDGGGSVSAFSDGLFNIHFPDRTLYKRVDLLRLVVKETRKYLMFKIKCRLLTNILFISLALIHYFNHDNIILNVVHVIFYAIGFIFLCISNPIMFSEILIILNNRKILKYTNDKVNEIDVLSYRELYYYYDFYNKNNNVISSKNPITYPLSIANIIKEEYKAFVYERELEDELGISTIK